MKKQDFLQDLVEIHEDITALSRRVLDLSSRICILVSRASRLQEWGPTFHDEHAAMRETILNLWVMEDTTYWKIADVTGMDATAVGFIIERARREGDPRAQYDPRQKPPKPAVEQDELVVDWDKAFPDLPQDPWPKEVGERYDQQTIEQLSKTLPRAEPPPADKPPPDMNGIQKRAGRWQVSLKHKGKKYHLGTFDDLHEAAAARDAGMARRQQGLPPKEGEAEPDEEQSAKSPPELPTQSHEAKAVAAVRIMPDAPELPMQHHEAFYVGGERIVAGPPEPEVVAVDEAKGPDVTVEQVIYSGRPNVFGEDQTVSFVDENADKSRMPQPSEPLSRLPEADEQPEMPAGTIPAKAKTMQETLATAAGNPFVGMSVRPPVREVPEGQIVEVDSEHKALHGPTGWILIDRALVPVFRHMADGQLYQLADLAQDANLKIADLTTRMRGMTPKLNAIGVLYDDTRRQLVRLMRGD